MTGIAAPSVRGGAAPLAYSHDDMTHVELTWVEKQIEYWIRFGREAHNQILDRRRRVVSFLPHTVFAFVRWAANDFGTITSRIDIVRAITRCRRHVECSARRCSFRPWNAPMSTGGILRAPSYSRVAWRVRGGEAGKTTARWQDKRPHIARRSGGCFCRDFRPDPHIAALPRNVRQISNALYRRDLLHIAGSRHGR